MRRRALNTLLSLLLCLTLGAGTTWAWAQGGLHPCQAPPAAAKTCCAAMAGAGAAPCACPTDAPCQVEAAPALPGAEALPSQQPWPTGPSLSLSLPLPRVEVPALIAAEAPQPLSLPPEERYLRHLTLLI